MVQAWALLSALSAFVPAAIHGSAIETNPVAIIGDVAVLTHDHPAYGAYVPDEVAAYEVRAAKDEDAVVVVGANMTDPSSRFRSRMLESSSRDLQKLEEHFQTKMEVNFKTLSSAPYRKCGTDTAPWPSSYWPIYQDGINAQWSANHKSPAEKYALGFGLDPKQFMDKVSKTNGVLSQKTRRKCKQTSDCDSLNDASICGIRTGESSGFCIPGWFGICHAWAPAAILEAEPKCPVTRNNVTFQPMDIKALLTEIYDGASVQTVFTGARFNGPDEPAIMDEFGRYTDAARRDVGPGFFHIAITNIMGKFKKGFVVDVTAGAQVWNQPVRNFDVVEMTEMDVKQASQQFFKRDTYPFNPDVKALAYVKTNFFWVVEALDDGPLVSTGLVDQHTESATYEYLLELDADRNIIGGEWLSNSRYEHPDFLWFPTGKPAAGTVTSVGLKYADVEQLLADSLKCEQTPVPTTPAPTTPEPTTPEPTTPEPTTPTPTTPEPTTPTPTTPEPTTPAPTTPEVTTPAPSTPEVTTPLPTTPEVTTPLPTTPEVTTPLPTTPEVTTPLPTTPEVTTAVPSTPELTTAVPTTPEVTTPEPTTGVPTTPAPTTDAPAATTPSPTTVSPATDAPSNVPVTPTPSTATPTTDSPATDGPTTVVPPTDTPSTTTPVTTSPSTDSPSTDDSDDTNDEPPATVSPQTPAPTQSPATVTPTAVPTATPTTTPSTDAPTTTPTTTPSTDAPTDTPSTAQCGKHHIGLDFYGDDITQVYWVSQGECCDYCVQTDGCKAYTYVAQDTWGGASCYLKSGQGTLRPKQGAISAHLIPSSSSSDNTPTQSEGSDMCGAPQQNIDFFGADLMAVEASSPAECCDACANTKHCKAYSLVQNVCYLKHGKGKRRHTPGVISGVIMGQQQQW